MAVVEATGATGAAETMAGVEVGTGATEADSAVEVGTEAKYLRAALLTRK